MNEEPILMLACYHCGKLQYPSNREKGKACKCGSLHARPVNPTFLRRVLFIMHEQHGFMNKIKEICTSVVVA